MRSLNYVDKANMNRLLMEQKVERRRAFHSPSRKKSRRLHTCIDGFEQRPRQPKRHYKLNKIRSKPKSHSFMSIICGLFKRDPVRKPVKKAGFKAGPRTKPVQKTRVLRFPRVLKRARVSAVPICLLGGIAIFSIITLNWRRTVPASVSIDHDPSMTTQLATFAPSQVHLDEAAAEPVAAKPAAVTAVEVKSEDSTSAPAAAEPEETPPEMYETFKWENYRVKAGDSVSSIAASHSLSMDAVIASNSISSARRLKAGETLRLPNMDGIPYKVRSGDSISKISARMDVPVDAILDANDLPTETIRIGSTLFLPGAHMRTEDLRAVIGDLFKYPLSHWRLSSPFGWRIDPISHKHHFHTGIDMAAPIGTPIRAAKDGRVSATGESYLYGNYVVLTHGDGYQTLYAHMSRVLVKKGVWVKQGEVVGKVGTTGYSTGPHLHFGVYKNKKPINPLEVLKS
jgi:murein DD-endopeptidase MepM/ murein hydrolase activator NlpD